LRLPAFGRRLPAIDFDPANTRAALADHSDKADGADKADEEKKAVAIFALNGSYLA
jgi:hypothetical protein